VCLRVFGFVCVCFCKFACYCECLRVFASVSLVKMLCLGSVFKTFPDVFGTCIGDVFITHIGV